MNFFVISEIRITSRAPTASSIIRGRLVRPSVSCQGDVRFSKLNQPRANKEEKAAKRWRFLSLTREAEFVIGSGSFARRCRSLFPLVGRRPVPDPLTERGGIETNACSLSESLTSFRELPKPLTTGNHRWIPLPILRVMQHLTNRRWNTAAHKFVTSVGFTNLLSC